MLTVSQLVEWWQQDGNGIDDTINNHFSWSIFVECTISLDE